MKAWRVTNKISHNYTESTSPITIKREVINSYGITIKQEVIEKIFNMKTGEISIIGDLEIECKNT